MAKFDFSNKQIALMFREVAAVLEIKNENRFRVIAYQNAADTIENLSTSIYTLWEQNQLKEVSGIGKGITEHLSDLFTKGKSDYLEEIKKQVPAGVFGLLNTASIGPKTAFKLAAAFHLTSADTAAAKVLTAGKNHKIQELPGFGAKSEADIISALEGKLIKTPDRLRIDTADELAYLIIEFLKKSPLVIEISALGSLRRRVSTVGDVDIGVATDDQTKFLEYIKTYPEAKDIQAAGENMIRLIHINGYHVDIKIISPQEWGSLLQHFTGSKAHNIHLRQFALTQGKSLSEWGIKSNGKLQKYTDEKKFYNDIKLDWIPPELREDRGEIEAAFKHKLPKLIELKDVKGDFHTHTNYDWVSSHDVGQSSFHELVDKALELNYKYFGLGDHNPSTGNYLSSEIIELLHKRQETIEKFKKQLVKEGINLAIFNTLEIDIKPDGSLAVPIDALKYLDYAVISIHSNLREDKVTQTKRLLTAMDYPKVKIIGHPTGRLINKRQGFELDWSQIFARCLENNIALEINANPVRLDIDEFVVRDAINHGVLLTIDTDTHHISNMDLMCFGVDVARRGWAESQNIVNAWPVDKVKQWMKVIK